MADLGNIMAGLVKEKKEKGESKHYIPFNAKEWAELEAQAKMKLEPKNLKLMIQNIFAGEYDLVPKAK